MAHHRERPGLGGATTVTYSRMPSAPKRSPAAAPGADAGAGPVLTASEIPFADRPADVPEVRGLAGERPQIDAAFDLFGGKRRPRVLRAVMLVGALAIVAGIGVLAVAYNAAVNARIDRPVAAVAPTEPADVAGATGVRAVGAEPAAAAAVDAVDARLATAKAPAEATPAPGESPSAEAATAYPVPAGEDVPATAAAPTPRPRAGAANEARADGGARPPAQTEMDRLMGEIDAILAGIPPTNEPVDVNPPPPAPMVLGPVPPAAMSAPPGPGPVLVTPPGALGLPPPLPAPSASAESAASAAAAPLGTAPPPPPPRRLFPLLRRQPPVAPAQPLPPADVPSASLPADPASSLPAGL